jgi:SAM-dependent methyltransferase
MTARWPKPVLELTPEEAALKQEVCLECQQWGYTGVLGWVQRQGHLVAEQLSQARSNGKPLRSLEIGCGSGYHFQHVGDGLHFGLDYEMPHLRRARERYPNYPVLQGDAYNLPFRSGAFDRVVSIYVFEHLHRLPECLAEVKRILKPGGELLVGLPAEGGLAYELGRSVTTKRHFERTHKVDYMKLVRSEHCNTCAEVLDELRQWFRVETVQHLPFRVPLVHLSAIVVARCVNDGIPGPTLERVG